LLGISFNAIAPNQRSWAKYQQAMSEPSVKCYNVASPFSSLDRDGSDAPGHQLRFPANELALAPQLWRQGFDGFDGFDCYSSAIRVPSGRLAFATASKCRFHETFWGGWALPL